LESEDELLRRLEEWLATKSEPPTIFDVIETGNGLLIAAFVTKAFRAAAITAVEERERVRRIRAAALSHYKGHEQDAESFLRSPNAALRGRTPLQAAVGSQGGAEEVMRLLGRHEGDSDT
jgi:hypothetical protein